MSQDENLFVDEVLESNRKEYGATANEAELKKQTQQALKVIKSFESDKISLNRRLIKLMVIITIASIIVAFASFLSSLVILNMKKVEAFVIQVDKSEGGYAEIAKPITDQKTTYGEELDKYWLSTFVINRQSYDWETIQNMYDIVNLMSSDDVFSQYKRYINNKDSSPLHLLRDKKSIVAQVKSITFIGLSGDNVAQVRYLTYVRNNDGTTAKEFPPQHWIATIAYDYKKTIKTEAERRVNPLGFRSVSYKVDSEKLK